MNRAKILLLILIFFTIVSFGFVFLKPTMIKGFVADGEKRVSFAKVKIKATSNSTLADYNGVFTIDSIDNEDSLIVAAWANGYYNGEVKAMSGDSLVQIELHKLFEEDNENYQFISPFSEEGKELNCQNCHTDILISQWENNAHGQSAKNPFFHAMYYGTNFEGDSTSGVSFKSDFPDSFGNCATCHIPGAAIDNPWGIDPSSVKGANTNGVYCDVCHKIKNVIHTSGQGTSGILSIEFLRPPNGKQVFFGPYIDVHEPDSYSPIISKSEFCMPCHNAKFWNIPAYQTFSEWESSPYPEMGVQCQTCHMFPDGKLTNFAPGNGGVERDPMTIPSHSQPGSRDTSILKNSVTLALSTEVVNDSIIVQVVIINDKTGHHVPAGRPSRNMILLVEGVDESGNKLEFISGEKVPFWGGVGDVDEGNFANLAGKGFVKLLQDFEGRIPSPVWRPTYIVSDNRIPAMKSDTSIYIFKRPSNFQKVEIRTKLIYRRFYKKWMDEKQFNIPDIIMEEEINTILNSSTSIRTIGNSKIYVSNGFPNPFFSNLNFIISCPQKTEVAVKIVNIIGTTVYSNDNIYLSPGNNSIRFDLNAFQAGTYYCVFSDSQKQIMTRKIIKYE